jgi:hypothetical protein
MKISNNTLPFLEGKAFDAGLSVPIATPEPDIISRFRFLTELAKNKSIVHLGCCDHVPLIKEKINNGVWLHQLLMDSAHQVIGLDINKEGIEFLQDDLKINHVYCSNILEDNLPEESSSGCWDYLVMGEILEHVDNPVQFMSAIKKKHHGKIKQVVITVPNALCITNFEEVKNNMELINTDHRYWFTPFTLAKVLTLAGYQVDDFYFAQEVSSQIGWRAKIKVFPYLKRKMRYRQLCRYPAYRDTLIMIASI